MLVGCGPTFKEGNLNFDRFPTVTYHNCDELSYYELICEEDICCIYVPIHGVAKCCNRPK